MNSAQTQPAHYTAKYLDQHLSMEIVTFKNNLPRYYD